MSDRAPYWVNVWEHRTRRDSAGSPIYEPDTFTVEADALENILDSFDGWRYVETIHRQANGVATVSDRRRDAEDLEHERYERDRAESERMACYTRQRRAS